MHDNLRWSWCNNNRNKVHSQCNALQSSFSQSVEKLSSLVPKRLETAALVYYICIFVTSKLKDLPHYLFIYFFSSSPSFASLYLLPLTHAWHQHHLRIVPTHSLSHPEDQSDLEPLQWRSRGGGGEGLTWLIQAPKYHLRPSSDVEGEAFWQWPLGASFRPSSSTPLVWILGKVWISPLRASVSSSVKWSQ